jgi:hypothetical protein
MTRTCRNAALAAMLVSTVMVGSAGAGIISVSSAVGGAPIGAVLDNLNLIPLGSAGGVGSSLLAVTFGGDGKAVQGSLSGIYAAPYLSGSNGAGFGNAPGVDATTYLSTGVGNVTIVLPALQTYFGLLWGSVDAYNTLSFYNGATLVDSLTGSNVIGLANGDQGVNGTVYVNIGFDTAFNRVVATSSQYAFEFDNVAFSPTNPVPEPGSLLLFGIGLIGMGAIWRKRRA